MDERSLINIFYITSMIVYRKVMDERSLINIFYITSMIVYRKVMDERSLINIFYITSIIVYRKAMDERSLIKLFALSKLSHSGSNIEIINMVARIKMLPTLKTRMCRDPTWFVTVLVRVGIIRNIRKCKSFVNVYIKQSKKFV